MEFADKLWYQHVTSFVHILAGLCPIDNKYIDRPDGDSNVRSALFLPLTGFISRYCDVVTNPRMDGMMGELMAFWWLVSGQEDQLGITTIFKVQIIVSYLKSW